MEPVESFFTVSVNKSITGLDHVKEGLDPRNEGEHRDRTEKHPRIFHQERESFRKFGIVPSDKGKCEKNKAIHRPDENNDPEQCRTIKNSGPVVCNEKFSRVVNEHTDEREGVSVRQIGRA